MTPSSNASSHLEKPDPHDEFSTHNPSDIKGEAAGQIRAHEAVPGAGPGASQWKMDGHR